MLTHTYRPAAILSVTGADAGAFLQGQFTNELRQANGAAVYGLWLNQKGKVLADSQVLKETENEFRLVSTVSPAVVIGPRLEEYIVADDVVLTDETAQFRGLALCGEQARDVLGGIFGAVPQRGHFARVDETFVFPGRRSSEENYELIGPENSIVAIRQKLGALGAREATVVEMEFARITAGLPAVPQDIGPGDLPNEGNLEDAAISYTKGCYLGQEVMARLKNLGQVRRRLHVIRGRGTAPQVSGEIYQGAKKIGQIRSVATNGNEFVALAMLSLVNFDPAAGLSSAPGSQPSMTVVSHG